MACNLKLLKNLLLLVIMVKGIRRDSQKANSNNKKYFGRFLRPVDIPLFEPEVTARKYSEMVSFVKMLNWKDIQAGIPSPEILSGNGRTTTGVDCQIERFMDTVLLYQIRKIQTTFTKRTMGTDWCILKINFRCSRYLETQEFS